MVISLRKRPVCYYCGQRNNPVNAQKYKCKNCLADNFLDENGDIVDVPTEVAQSTTRYAIAVEPSDPSLSIFCSTCLKNQHMYTDAMSHFLPDFDHPEYSKFEDALPEFKRRMEQQYPQCCVDCEPKVQARLQQATYHARSDNLRRVLDRSKRKTGGNLGWRSLVVNGAGLAYLISLVIQLSWHAIGSQASKAMMLNIRPTDCFLQRPAAQCPDMVERFMGISLLLGVVFGWWNPKWQHKLKGRKGRLIGLTGYYRAQIAVLVVRFATWVAVRDVPALEQHRPMLHSLSLVLIILIMGYTNLGIIKVDTTPLVNWQEKQKPLLTSNQYKPYVSTQLLPKNDLIQNFESTQSRVEAWRPPTPPTDDAMDWAPSSAPFVPQPKKITYKSTQPSPFTGTIPALPKRGIFADRSKDQPEPAKAIGIPQGFFDKRDTLKEAKSNDQAFAQPKFFPRDTDTGLEMIFGKVFSLDENAVEVRNQQASTQQMIDSSAHDNKEILLRTVTVVILGLMTVYITANNYLGVEIDRRVIIWVGVVPIFNLVLAMVQIIDTFKIGSNVIGGIVLAGLHFNFPGYQSLLLPLWNKSLIGITSLLLLQEIYSLCTISTIQQNRGPHQSVNQQRDQSLTRRKPDEEITRQIPDQFITSSQPVSDAWGLPDIQQSSIMPEIPFTPQINRSRRDSIESINSNTSSSTSSTWKTPRVDNRMTRSVGPLTRNSGFGIGSLGLDDYSTGNTVAGPRSRSRRGQPW